MMLSVWQKKRIFVENKECRISELAGNMTSNCVKGINDRNSTGYQFCFENFELIIRLAAVLCSNLLRMYCAENKAAFYNNNKTVYSLFVLHRRAHSFRLVSHRRRREHADGRRLARAVAVHKRRTSSQNDTPWSNGVCSLPVQTHLRAVRGRRRSSRWANAATGRRRSPGKKCRQRAPKITQVRNSARGRRRSLR